MKVNMFLSHRKLVFLYFCMIHFWMILTMLANHPMVEVFVQSTFGWFWACAKVNLKVEFWSHLNVNLSKCNYCINGDSKRTTNNMWCYKVCHHISQLRQLIRKQKLPTLFELSHHSFGLPMTLHSDSTGTQYCDLKFTVSGWSKQSLLNPILAFPACLHFIFPSSFFFFVLNSLPLGFFSFLPSSFYLALSSSLS